MLENRQYQLFIVSEILRAKQEGKSLIIELDAGLGKRIISYLLVRYLGKNERILIITPSQASVRDTFLTFSKLYSQDGGKVDDIGYISAGIPRKMKEFIIREKRVVITTPISLANLLKKLPGILSKFNLIVVNEVDKVVRRTAIREESIEEEAGEELITADTLAQRSVETKKVLTVVYPWSDIIREIPKNIPIVGMSGTLRDKHALKSEGKIIFRPEIETLLQTLYKGRNVDIITMDKVIRSTDIQRFLLRNITIVKPIGIKDEKVKIILDALTEEMHKVAKKLADKYQDMLEDTFTGTVERAIGLIPDSDFLKMKFLRLALVRKFVSSSIPEHYTKFLMKKSIRKLIEKFTGKKLKEVIPEKSAKIERILKIAAEWLKNGRKVVILASYIKVAIKIKSEFERAGYKSLLLTGKTFNKGAVLNSFKEAKKPVVLIMTPVGERDIDLADIDLIIIHDVISTIKTMYQRFKRGRRSRVLVMYYEDTFEQEKVFTLLQKMQKKYPWTLKVDL